jgi:hypothetical protein
VIAKYLNLCIASCIVSLCCIAPLGAQDSENQYPHWLQQWRTWATASKDPVFIEWAETLSTPEAVSLGKEWESLLGYNAVDLVAKDTKAPRIKPGLIITPENISAYEKELRELFPFGFDWEVDRLTGKGVFAGYNYSPLEMIIVPTTHAWNDRGFLEATKRYSDACRINQKGELEGWVAGIPFPFPTTALEIVHNYDRLTVMADNLNSMPMSIGLYGRDGKRERVEKIELHWQNYSGRIKLDPFPTIPGSSDIYEKGSILALYPYDLKGFAAVRTRFKDSAAEDSFISYIPSMRRIRRLSGSNTQDPLVGSDASWEDWKGYWSKLSVHPAEYQLLGKAIVLCPSFNPRPIKYQAKYGGWCQQYWWERRPVWVVKITYKESSYLYGARIWYVDRETFALQQEMFYDRNGRLWKLWDWCWRWNPANGELNYWNPYILDIINKHSSIFDHHIMLNMPNLSEDLFTIRYLMEKGH